MLLLIENVINEDPHSKKLAVNNFIYSFLAPCYSYFLKWMFITNCSMVPGLSKCHVKVRKKSKV